VEGKRASKKEKETSKNYRLLDFEGL